MNLKVPALACALLASACTSRIQHGLDEKAANEVQTVLLGQGLGAEKSLEPGKKPTWAISVPDDQADAAVQLLAALGLPRAKAKGFADMKGSLVPTPIEQQVQFVELLAGELEQTLEATEGVLSARVHLVISQSPRPSQPPPPSRASALLKVRPGMGARVKAAREELKELIAGGVQGLAVEDVALVVDEVALPPAAPRQPAGSRWLRWLAAGMGGLVTLLSAVLLAVGVQQRSRRQVKGPSQPDAPTRTPAMPIPRATTTPATRKVA